MGDITYREMVARYGDKIAYGLLLTIEQSAGLHGGLAAADEEARLRRALRLMNETQARCARASGH
jgi:hypothetical protein